MKDFRILRTVGIRKINFVIHIVLNPSSRVYQTVERKGIVIVLHLNDERGLNLFIAELASYLKQLLSQVPNFEESRDNSHNCQY